MNAIAHKSPLSALLVGEFPAERLLVHDIFQKCGWRLYEAPDRRRALQSLNRHPVQVVIGESDLPSWNWQRMLHDLQGLDASPQLVVTSRTADEQLWAEVLNVGAYDLLARPFDREELERVVAAACRHQANEHLRQRGLLSPHLAIA
jgi:DNA-binding NtrC family response regulator